MYFYVNCIVVYDEDDLEENIQRYFWCNTLFVSNIDWSPQKDTGCETEALIFVFVFVNFFECTKTTPMNNNNKT